MKKLFLFLGMSLMTTGLFANEIAKSETINIEKEECCTRKAVDEEGDVLISVRICGQGSTLMNCIKAEDELARLIYALMP